jgi:short-subunit dehydrogenase
MPGSLQTYSAMVATGGSSGIGAALIKLATSLNRRLWLGNLSRSEPSLLGEIPRLRHFPCNLGDREGTAKAAAEVMQAIDAEAEAGPVLLVNNSGFGAYGLFPEPNLEHHLGMLEVNISACVQLVGLFLPLFDKRGGAVVNIASAAAFQPCPLLATYGATKAFLMNWSLALSHDLAPRGVQVLCVCPGPTRTNFFKAAGFDEPPADAVSGLSAETVARDTIRGLERGKKLVVNGWDNRALAFLSSKLPRTWAAAAAARAIGRWRRQR